VKSVTTSVQQTHDPARWLLYRGKDAEAEKALNKIHGSAPHRDMIVQEQLAILNKSREEEAESSSSQSKWSDLWRESPIMFGPDIADEPGDPIERKKLIATVGILVSQQISGVQFIFSYTTTFFTLVGLDDTFIITVGPMSGLLWMYTHLRSLSIVSKCWVSSDRSSSSRGLAEGRY
jgi:hypothetical protein